MQRREDGMEEGRESKEKIFGGVEWVGEEGKLDRRKEEEDKQNRW